MNTFGPYRYEAEVYIQYRIKHTALHFNKQTHVVPTLLLADTVNKTAK
jgi:hypothetical protein